MYRPVIRFDIKNKRLWRLFWETWAQIPDFDQDTIKSKTGLITDHDVPVKYFGKVKWAGLATADPIEFTASDGDVREWPMMIVYLHGETLKDYPDDEVKGVIAHELAHALNGMVLAYYPLHHPGIAQHYVGKDMSTGFWSREELAADDRARDWGFETTVSKLRRLNGVDRTLIYKLVFGDEPD